LFARIDAGLALLAALAINRTGGIEKHPGAKAEAVHARDFMWEPPPDAEAEPDRPATLEDLKRIFGVR
jgi:hypothetical protein